MSYNELHNLFNYDEKETSLYMPNEIFKDLQKYIKNTPHIAFAYTYIYLITWLYRYAKHFNVEVVLDNKKLKEVLGYSSKNQTMDYLIKKGGLLDEIEYLDSTRDYVINWQFNKSTDEALSFFMFSDIDREINDYFPSVPKRFFLKKPLKAFYRVIEEENDEYEIAGTFYDISNTHNIPFEVFLFCVSNSKIGCTGFYLYAYLKHKNDIFESGYDVSIEELSQSIGVARRTLINYLGQLKSYKMIDFKHNQDFFAIGLEDRKANTYITRDYGFFYDRPIPFKRIKYMPIDMVTHKDETV